MDVRNYEYLIRMYVEKKNEILRSNFTDFKYKKIQNFCVGWTSSNYIQDIH